MTKTTIIGYPRIGVQRELKFAVEKYFKESISERELREIAKRLREEYWITQKENGIDIIPSNDFSFYDNFLDTAFLLNVIPKRYKRLKETKLETYFAMARGYQKNNRDVKALPMKKWFNTNYHYIVPELEEDAELKINDDKPFELFKEANKLGIKSKPTIIGPFTFIKLVNIKGDKNISDWKEKLVEVYKNILFKFNEIGLEYLQIDEPILVTDLTEDDIKLFNDIYTNLLEKERNYKLILQTYFGDVRDIYTDLLNHKFDGIALDFVEGFKNIELIKNHGFPKDKLLIAGVVNGKNIWRNNYEQSISLIEELRGYIPEEKLILGTSCSLLHVPYTIKKENLLEEEYKETLAFAEEKLEELNELRELINDKNYKENIKFINNRNIIQRKKFNHLCFNEKIRERITLLKEEDFRRNESFEERRERQKKELKLPILPTTTIGSFPQTEDVKKARKAFRGGEITEIEYEDKIKEKIKEIVEFQEEINIDVLVHGEYERTDMVEYFGRLLDGFIFTSNGWVQSYGTRGVKPPIIFGDIQRSRDLTVKWSNYAQGLTDKPVKGMLTGPITILNWSFPREDLDLKNIAYQIGVAIGDEVLALEESGIKIIQIDEAALREKLPIRMNDWNKDYLDWAIPAFRLTNSRVKASTSIHTHMCYSEFSDIVKAIEYMDVDVISIEAARSTFLLLDFLRESDFKLEIGPGVYDIHSPRIPKEGEIEELIKIIINKLDINKVWINPDCGLKTRGIEETQESLRNMVNVTKRIREELGYKH
ncbi:5-methyltetrahydropteroyltriglutamate--homocysteine S-methyltransferase [Clostridium paraputrificum]|uniref:5-methyltetrahydropteroyltriglutamate-- homocysteine S-methyltransferase n=1 Tax=Clostridium TaxID=1485 RepID=UPI003D32FF26